MLSSAIQCQDDKFHKTTSSSAHIDKSGQHEAHVDIPAQGGQIKQQAEVDQTACVPVATTKASYIHSIVVVFLEQALDGVL